ADWDNAPGMGVVLTNEPGDASWPVTAATFILVHKEQSDAAQGKAVLEFFDWAWKNGAEAAAELDYVPLPDEVTNKVRNVWKTEIKANGQPVWK
ncbi:MAG: phosphate ABC transporter substrate-binding protein PstS, partial [Candidimonas sp.]